VVLPAARKAGLLEVAEAVARWTEAFTVGTQGGEEVGGDHAAASSRPSSWVMGSMQPLTGCEISGDA
jgi:hypothetical protein